MSPSSPTQRIGTMPALRNALKKSPINLSSYGLLCVVLFVASCTSCDAYAFTPRGAFSAPSRDVVRRKTRRSGPPSTLLMSTDEKGKEGSFSISSLFNKKTPPGGASSVTHPGKRDHISPLNSLHPTKLGKDGGNLRGSGTESLPMHPEVTSGVLENGLSYVILPNASPPGRFEAHLQVFSGSADELEKQQGIAHLTEHVAYMGSRKRERLFGTGSQTNAYTDFHHTVFYAACPIRNPSDGRPMLPMALDALVDVMEARVESARLEKERNAVLSEMTMVNTIEYRVECQILGALHRENRLARRFPIGKEELIRAWQPDDVRTWHRTHYRPDNVLLYIVGDIQDMDGAKKIIQDKFGRITAENQAGDIDKNYFPDIEKFADGVLCDTVKSTRSWHYPPIVHEWCDYANAASPVPTTTDANPQSGDESLLFQLRSPDEPPATPATHLSPQIRLRPHIFHHPLLRDFSLHLYAKRPVEPITCLSDLRQALARRVALAALQVRLNVGGRSESPPFSFVEFNQLDSAREGCAICSLDLTAEPGRWREATVKAVSEVKRLGEHGVTRSELQRYAGALMTDAYQLASQGDRISHGDQLAYLMETVSNGHVFMSPEENCQMTEMALSSLELEDVNRAAREMCSHITGYENGTGEDGVVVAVACAPKDCEGDAFCDENNLVEAIVEACGIEVQPEQEVLVPRTLLEESDLEELQKHQDASWLPGKFTDGTPESNPEKLTRPFTLRRLGNGIRVGVAKNVAESQRGHLRLVAPGGRDAEARLGLKPGSMALGARTLQEGGAFGKWSREQVELFCVDHLLMVEIVCTEESLIFDFLFPTTNVGNSGFGDEKEMGITGTEAVLQIVRGVLSDFQWEGDALGRAKSSFRAAHESLQKNLEGLSTETIMEAMTDGDARFLSIDNDTVDDISIDDAKNAVLSQLLPAGLEFSVVGDFEPREVLELIRKYVGTIPANANSEFARSNVVQPVAEAPNGSIPTTPDAKFLSLELPDSDPRAVAYVSGAAPNIWGFFKDGTTVSQKIGEGDAKASDYDRQRRGHPLFANACLLLLSEIINRRLFSTVREKRQLTYDANFSLTNFERLYGGYFLVTVTASKDKAQAALEACIETLNDLSSNSKITPDGLESSKRVVLNRHEGELRTARYWAEMMSGMQDETIPLKGPYSFTEFPGMVNAITVKDLQMAFATLGLTEKTMFTTIGQTIQPEGLDQEDYEDVLVKMTQSSGFKRGGALMG